METFQMSQTRAYGTGGTLHIVINNQVGFTTSRRDDARSTEYCTDVAKMVETPIFHVNADDPDAVLFIAQLAMDYRYAFKKDVVIDLVCYRRRGHNEADDPSATQPLMYKTIRTHKTTRTLYTEQLTAAGLIAQEEADAMMDNYREALDRGESVATGLVSEPDRTLFVDWSPSDGERRHLGPHVANRRNQDAPLDVVVHLADQRADNGCHQKARQQPQRGDQRYPAIFLAPALHGQREGEDQADRTGQGRGNRLLQQKSLRIIDEYPLEGRQRGAENDAGLEGVRQPDNEASAQPGDTQHEQQQSEVQRQCGHGLQAQTRVLAYADGEGQYQRQRRSQPARRVGFAEHDQGTADEYRMDHGGRHRLLEGQTEEHGHDGNQRQPGGSGDEDALQQLRPIQPGVVEGHAEGERPPAPAWQLRSRHV